MTKQCIEKKRSDIDYQKLFSDISSPDNLWNESDEESEKEESVSNDYTERWKNINTDYALNVWMLCVLPHIR